MKSYGWIVIICMLVFLTVSCVKQETQPVKVEPAVSSQPQPEKKVTSPYEAEIKPLATEDCARCHFSYFTRIKKDGGKHSFDCARCHELFHAYNPQKQNWQEIMPKCEKCHGVFHGEKFPACTQCHSDPHTPKKMAMTQNLTSACAGCHSKVGQEITQNVTKHTKVDCAKCHHTKHGYIPGCMECHKPHVEGQTVKECLACHPVHSPLNIKYADTTPNNVCGSCHSAELDKIKRTASKHKDVTCAKCHNKHKYIPKCEECHSKPHSEALLKNFPNCLQCHMDVHDLPAKAAAK